MVIAFRSQPARPESKTPTRYYDDYGTSGFVQVAGSAVPRRGADEIFAELAARWQTDTIDLSSTHALVLHPAYQQIIGLGVSAVPLLLRELRDRPAPWFFALSAITRDDPTAGVETFDGAVEAWLTWGHDRRLI